MSETKTGDRASAGSGVGAAAKPDAAAKPGAVAKPDASAEPRIIAEPGAAAKPGTAARVGAAVRTGARGTVTGLAATAAMSAVFVIADRSGAIDRPPPRSIIDHFLPFVPPEPSDRLAAATHFVYGAGGGVAFEALMHALHEPPLGRRLALGAAYGLAVWAAGYEGWVPAMNVLPPAHRDHPARVATEVAAHLVYGLTLGIAGHVLHRRAARRIGRAGTVEA